jgi:hypothetical protein
MITTTLNEIRKHHPCTEGWERLLKHLGKTKADDEPLEFTTILDSNGLNDCCWAMRARPDLNNLWRHFAVDCAERVKGLMTDERSRNALVVARRHATGHATDTELRDAGLAAWDAWRVDADAASDAAAWAAWYNADEAAIRTVWMAAEAADEAKAEAVGTERMWQIRHLRHLLTTGTWTPMETTK